MLNVAAVLFAIAAMGGAAMAYMHFAKNRNPPVAVAVAHGVLGATALAILGWSVLHTGGTTAPVAWSLGLFVVAALGGFFLVSNHARGRRLPSVGVIAHALVAVAGFLLLVYGIWNAAQTV